jgi:hypothetical protein
MLSSYTFKKNQKDIVASNQTYPTSQIPKYSLPSPQVKEKKCIK